MTYVKEKVLLPDMDLANANDRVVIALSVVDGNDKPVEIFDDGNDAIIVSPTRFLLPTSGKWIENLPANALGSPADTVYRRVVEGPNYAYTRYFTVPTAQKTPVNITASSRSGTTVSLVVTSSTGYTVGEDIVVANLTGNGAPLNGVWVVSNVPDATHVEYQHTASGTIAAGGAGLLGIIWRSDENPASVNFSVESSALTTHTRVPDAHQNLQSVALFRAQLERVRGKVFPANVSMALAMLGDSWTEGFNASKRGLMTGRYLSRRLNSHNMSGYQYIPAACNTNSDRSAGQWPGAQAPVVYSADPAGLVDHGADLHAVNMVSGSTATVTWFGDTINVVYTRTPGGPAAAAVTLDGVAQATINASGSELVGQQATYGTIGDYGFHTLVVTSTAGVLLLEGFTAADSEGNALGLPLGTVRVIQLGHAGFSTQFFADNNNWATSLAKVTCNPAVQTDLSHVYIELCLNDPLLNVPASRSYTNLKAIMAKIDAAVAATGVTSQPGYTLAIVPGVLDDYADAIWAAANSVDSERCGVHDLREHMTGHGANMGILNNNGHPDDGGSLWWADQIAAYLEGPGITRNVWRTPKGLPGADDDIIIDARTPAESRSQWAENFVLSTAGTSQGQIYDATTADSTVRERRHGKWFENDATYSVEVDYVSPGATGGQVQVQIGPTVIGSATTGGTTDNMGRAVLGNFQPDSPGKYPIIVRKTAANAAALRLVRVLIRRTA